MIAPVPEADPLYELDARHDELLAQLDLLNQRLERVLAEYRPAKDGDEAKKDAA